MKWVSEQLLHGLFIIILRLIVVFLFHSFMGSTVVNHSLRWFNNTGLLPPLHLHETFNLRIQGWYKKWIGGFLDFWIWIIIDFLPIIVEENGGGGDNQPPFLLFAPFRQNFNSFLEPVNIEDFSPQILIWRSCDLCWWNIYIYIFTLNRDIYP